MGFFCIFFSFLSLVVLSFIRLQTLWRLSSFVKAKAIYQHGKTPGQTVLLVSSLLKCSKGNCVVKVGEEANQCVVKKK